MAGYHGSDGATARVLDGDGWLRTEDLARRRGLGLVELVGRKKDVINSGGHSVFAAEVEDALGRHPAVAETAVVGLPRSPLGEVPVAVAVPVRAGEVSEEDLLGWLAGRLATFKLPRRILFVDRLPTTGNGKVQKDVVRTVADQALANGAATQGGAG
jgi:fatty-acyl-CoA synthase